MATSLTIGILSPGAMGSALGRAWHSGGARIVSTVDGRSARTRSLATGLELLANLGEVVEAADIVVSIGPPGQARSMATAIASACRDRGRQPLVADLNAISPSTARSIADVLAGAGCELVDGSISGGPPTPQGSTRLYLSGRSARPLAELPAPGLVTRVVGPEVGTASAVKMCTAAVYKGFAGLLLQSLQTAYANGVADLVLTDLHDEFGPQLAGSAPLIASAVAKADRYPGEMREIAVAQRDAGAEPALYEAMAQVFEWADGSALGALTPEQAVALTDLDQVIAALRERRG